MLKPSGKLLLENAEVQSAAGKQRMVSVGGARVEPCCKWLGILSKSVTVACCVDDAESLRTAPGVVHSETL